MLSLQFPHRNSFRKVYSGRVYSIVVMSTTLAVLGWNYMSCHYSRTTAYVVPYVLPTAQDTEPRGEWRMKPSPHSVHQALQLGPLWVCLRLVLLYELAAHGGCLQQICIKAPHALGLGPMLFSKEKRNEPVIIVFVTIEVI